MTTSLLDLSTDTAARLRVAVGRVSRRLRATAASTSADLTPTKISILLTVVRDGPIRISALAAAEGVNPTMLSRAISTLSEAGLVQRTSDDGDRRAGWVQATPSGVELAEQMRRERTDAVNRALARCTAQERRALEAALPALESLAEHLREGDR
jgi:DNA-binding MarR family transcriptional regulator